MKVHAAWGCVFLIFVAPEPEAAKAEESADRYVLSYPAAEQFYPPVDGFFDEVQRTIDRVGNHTFRHQPNGGYGLPVVDQLGGAHLLHLGADVGFYRVGEPVYAVADGVVRLSQGPPKKDAEKTKLKPAKNLAWGNVIVIEHRLPDGKYATTIYGHLANDRLANAGDAVQAGQQIGTIGTTRVNGGYKPHLHFGVREGRMAELGRKLVLMTMEGKTIRLQIAAVNNDTIVLSGAKDLSEQLQMGLDGRKFAINKHDDKAEVSAAILSYLPSPEYMIVGYDLSTEGWMDPTAFLRSHGAEVNPAAFGAPPRRANSGVRT